LFRLPEGKVVTQRMPLEKWEVLIQDAFPAYISWERYMQNQERLRENAQGANWNKGAPRKGQALLQGIVICGRCGRRMRVRTGGRRPAYACYQANRDYGAPRCQHFTVHHIDEPVVGLFLEAIQPASLEVALPQYKKARIVNHDASPTKTIHIRNVVISLIAQPQIHRRLAPTPNQQQIPSVSVDDQCDSSHFVYLAGQFTARLCSAYPRRRRKAGISRSSLS
jgi:hypothetical protein